jgi:hypothetical protein
MPPAFTLVSCLAHFSTLKMEVMCSSETSVDFQWTTLCYIPEDRSLQTATLFTDVSSVLVTLIGSDYLCCLLQHAPVLRLVCCILYFLWNNHSSFLGPSSCISVCLFCIKYSKAKAYSLVTGLLPSRYAQSLFPSWQINRRSVYSKFHVFFLSCSITSPYRILWQFPEILQNFHFVPKSQLTEVGLLPLQFPILYPLFVSY